MVNTLGRMARLATSSVTKLVPVLGTIVAIPAWAISSLILHVVTWFGSA